MLWLQCGNLAYYNQYAWGIIPCIKSSLSNYILTCKIWTNILGHLTYSKHCPISGCLIELSSSIEFLGQLCELMSISMKQRGVGLSVYMHENLYLQCSIYACVKWVRCLQSDRCHDRSLECVGYQQYVLCTMVIGHVMLSGLENYHYVLTCSLPSLYLAAVVFAMAIPTSLYIFGNVIYTCLCPFFLHNRTLKEDIVYYIPESHLKE